MYKEEKTGKNIIGIVQPSYLPWLPFFERMIASDIFILLDDVEYSKNSFFNRNAIKCNGGKLLLTVPVLYSNNSKAKINEIEIDNKKRWREKHFRSIKMNYAHAPFWNTYKEKIQDLYGRVADTALLIDVQMPFITFFMEEFQINTPFFLSSSLNSEGERNEKLVNLCKHFSGTHFLVKPGTEGYHPPEEFQPYGVLFSFINYTKFSYPQMSGEFVPFLSALDFLLNVGPCNLTEYLSQIKKNEKDHE